MNVLRNDGVRYVKSRFPSRQTQAARKPRWTKRNTDHAGVSAYQFFCAMEPGAASSICFGPDQPEDTVMSTFNSASPEQIERLKADASALFGPVLLQEALRRLCKTLGSGCLDEFEKSMADRIDKMQDETPQFGAMKELAIEQLFAAVKAARAHPENKQPLENPASRRTKGRSEEGATLEEQLQSGLEDTFPASDPPAVVSTTISGGAKELTGVEEHLRRRREAAHG
jgi:hypothetical protein